MLYDNEAEIGAAIREKLAEGAIKREEIFITSKLWCNAMSPKSVEPALKKTLSNFGLDYLDLYLIHWPMAFEASEGGDFYPLSQNGKVKFSNTDYIDTWKAMEVICKKGLTKSIGVSNFTIDQLQRLLQISEIKPVVNQVEYHPYLNQNKLLSFCKANDVLIVAYSPLGSNDRPWAKKSDPLVMEDPRIQTLAQKYQKTPAQIILRYLIQIGLVPIPKSSNKKRIEENIDLFDYALAPQDIEAIDAFETVIRYHCHLETLGHPNYPFCDE
ncbi:unnamed protein product [Ceutorhynchus assimilis]|uniref:NADP-dependent oxidoreductase domain-containing protein n=1 Tax=Ceutorhynchus assimilis TaxID=467358 RepID=A0A9N9MKQ1_9CUCU|nr:unnamed protein product [Ceutorhynchus assimilis]